MSGGIFISYRRDDSEGFAGRIYDRIANRLNRERVFFDVDNIAFGVDFARVLFDRVADCDALVAIIGKDWLSATDEEKRRRIDDPADFVRIEIEAALQRDILVIPVLVGGAVMPREEKLPEALKPLARRQGLAKSHANFNSDAERLTKALAFVEEARRLREEAAAELEERQKQGAEAAQRAEENLRSEKAEAAQRAKEDRRNAEAEAARSDEVERRGREETEAEKRTDDEHRREPPGSAYFVEGSGQRIEQTEARKRKFSYWRLIAAAVGTASVVLIAAIYFLQNRAQYGPKENLASVAAQHDEPINAISQNEIGAYIEAHSDQFAKRQLFHIEQIAFAPPEDMVSVAAAAKDFKSLDQVEAKFNELGIKFSRGPATLDSATMLPEQLKALDARAHDDIFFLRSRNSATFFKVLFAEAKPLIGNDAEQFARRALQAKATPAAGGMPKN